MRVVVKPQEKKTLSIEIKVSVIPAPLIIQSTLGFATMGKAANLALATRNAVTDLF